MANEHGLFWDSYGGDRLYNAESMEEWLKPFFVTGVFNGHLQVTATSGMTVSVAPGYCNIEGKVKYYQNATTLTLEASSGTARTDNIVIERNDGDRTISLKVVKNGGTPIRESGIYQLVLAQITVAADATSITQEDILDTRWDSELCGYVVSTVDEVDFDQIAAQFNEWFENFHSHLDGDVAANLQAEIEDVAVELKRYADTRITNVDGDSKSLMINDDMIGLSDSIYYPDNRDKKMYACKTDSWKIDDTTNEMYAWGAHTSNSYYIDPDRNGRTVYEVTDKYGDYKIKYLYDLSDIIGTSAYILDLLPNGNEILTFNSNKSSSPYNHVYSYNKTTGLITAWAFTHGNISSNERMNRIFKIGSNIYICYYIYYSGDYNYFYIHKVTRTSSSQIVQGTTLKTSYNCVAVTSDALYYWDGSKNFRKYDGSTFTTLITTDSMADATNTNGCSLFVMDDEVYFSDTSKVYKYSDGAWTEIATTSVQFGFRTLSLDNDYFAYGKSENSSSQIIYSSTKHGIYKKDFSINKLSILCGLGSGGVGQITLRWNNLLIGTEGSVDLTNPWLFSGGIGMGYTGLFTACIHEGNLHFYQGSTSSGSNITHKIYKLDGTNQSITAADEGISSIAISGSLYASTFSDGESLYLVGQVTADDHHYGVFKLNSQGVYEYYCDLPYMSRSIEFSVVLPIYYNNKIHIFIPNSNSNSPDDPDPWPFLSHYVRENNTWVRKSIIKCELGLKVHPIIYDNELYLIGDYYTGFITSGSPNGGYGNYYGSYYIAKYDESRDVFIRYDYETDDRNITNYFTTKASVQYYGNTRTSGSTPWIYQGDLYIDLYKVIPTNTKSYRPSDITIKEEQEND